MGEGQDLHAMLGQARMDPAGVLREAHATGHTGGAAGQGEFSLHLTPDHGQRHLRLNAADGGALLAALDLAKVIRGGRLTVNASYGEVRPGAALTGTAELENFVLRDAPTVGKVLQALSIYGVIEAMQGGRGLTFRQLTAPFSLTPEALTLTDARAFSASLGVTAKGKVWREAKTAELEGTVVPSYLFNTLLGRIPVIGKLFSPEVGGGLIAATWRVQGRLADPQVSVNPLAALTPGALRGLFGLGAQRSEGAPTGGR
jgi:hypothetical protein